MAPSFKELTSNEGEDACCKAEQSRWKTEMEMLCCEGPREKDSFWPGGETVYRGSRALEKKRIEYMSGEQSRQSCGCKGQKHSTKYDSLEDWEKT